MTVAEATRQYQAMLEAERRIRAELDGVLSAEDVLLDAAGELANARAALERAWTDAEFGRIVMRFGQLRP
jgi:hypothetical protein